MQRVSNVHAVLDEKWSRTTTEQGRQAFEAAKEGGDLQMRNRGKKKATGKRESEAADDVPRHLGNVDFAAEAAVDLPLQFGNIDPEARK